MPFILRKIRRSKWFKNNNVPWLEEGELQADALFDLKSSGNKLSVYLIDDERTNFKKVVTALATANTLYLSDLDSAIFDRDILDEIDVKIEKTDGETPIQEVNTWHYHLVELTANKIMTLANVLATRSERKRFYERQLFEFIMEFIDSEEIDKSRLTPELLGGLGRRLIALKQYEYAESLLLESYNQFKINQGDRPLQIIEACQILVTLYEEWPKPDQADVFRALLL